MIHKKRRREDRARETRGREPSFHELGLLALGPGVVGDKEVEANGEGREKLADLVDSPMGPGRI